jgi:hypothetical protein
MFYRIFLPFLCMRSFSLTPDQLQHTFLCASRPTSGSFFGVYTHLQPTELARRRWANNLTKCLESGVRALSRRDDVQGAQKRE